MQQRLHEHPCPEGATLEGVEIAKRARIQLVVELLSNHGRVRVDHDQRREELVRRLGRECLRLCLLALELGDASLEQLDVRLKPRRRAGQRPRCMRLVGHC